MERLVSGKAPPRPFVPSLLGTQLTYASKDLDPVESIIQSQKDFEKVLSSDKVINEEKSLETQHKTQKVVSMLIKEDKEKLFELIKKLNARQQYAALAQKLLAEIWPRFTPDEIIEAFKDTKQLTELVEPMLMYSEKHYGRSDKSLK